MMRLSFACFKLMCRFISSSFKISDRVDPIADEVGAIHWKAPEVIEGQTQGSLAPDVCSFGMCILEAVKGGEVFRGAILLTRQSSTSS